MIELKNKSLQQINVSIQFFYDFLYTHIKTLIPNEFKNEYLIFAIVKLFEEHMNKTLVDIKLRQLKNFW